eukprot:scaffold172464_cov36-Cyclotella_meneghiniana.AAC.1
MVTWAVEVMKGLVQFSVTLWRKESRVVYVIITPRPPSLLGLESDEVVLSLVRLWHRHLRQPHTKADCESLFNQAGHFSHPIRMSRSDCC